MKGFLIILAAFFAVILGFTNPAYTAEGIKIGSFDGQRVMNESKKANEFTKSIEEFAKNKEKQLGLENDENELKKIDEEFKKQESILSPEARKEKAEQFKRKLDEYEKKRASLSSEVRKKRDEFSKTFVEKLENATKNIGKKEGFTLIIEKKGLFYAPDDFYPLDLTDRIIKEIDSQKQNDKK